MSTIQKSRECFGSLFEDFKLNKTSVFKEEKQKDSSIDKQMDLSLEVNKSEFDLDFIETNDFVILGEDQSSMGADLSCIKVVTDGVEVSEMNYHIDLVNMLQGIPEFSEQDSRLSISTLNKAFVLEDEESLGLLSI
jgi:hypothetical protein